MNKVICTECGGYGETVKGITVSWDAQVKMALLDTLSVINESSVISEKVAAIVWIAETFKESTCADIRRLFCDHVWVERS